jgi:hypothetical protein
MNIASVYDWFARDSMHAAEQTDDPRQREILSSWRCCGRPPHNRAATKHRCNRLSPTTASRPNSGGRAA